MAQTFVVASEKDAEGLLYELISECVFEGRPVGVDLETTGCNPQKESPVGRARLWCASFAWCGGRTAFVPAEFLHVLRPFLEDPRYPKVGTNLHGYDRHALANEGIELRGIVGCTSAMSRLLDPSKTNGHGLKAWGERLGYVTTAYNEVACVAVPGKEFALGLCPWCDWVGPRKKKCGGCGFNAHPALIPVPYQVVRWEEKDLDELWRDYPHKRQQIVDYACQDAAMSLAVFEHLKAELEGVRW